MRCKARDLWIVWALCFGDVGEMTLKEWQKRRWS